MKKKVIGQHSQLIGLLVEKKCNDVFISTKISALQIFRRLARECLNHVCIQENAAIRCFYYDGCCKNALLALNFHECPVHCDIGYDDFEITKTAIIDFIAMNIL